jgi:hypothetical protein
MKIVPGTGRCSQVSVPEGQDRIVARREVPGSAVWTFRRAETPSATESLVFQVFERGSGGPKGQESLAQG